MLTNFLSAKKEDVHIPAQKISYQCMLANQNPNAHGFNMAVVAFPGLNVDAIQPKPDLGRYKIHWRFFVLTLSITMKEYFLK